MKDLEKKIEYKFKNKALLKSALTHSSFVNENSKINIDSNERLEFLGDSVLSVITSEYLFTNFKKRTEGELTKLRAALVCEKSLSDFAVKLSLGDFLILGKGEEFSGARERNSTLADAFEAVIAAIYLDGGLDNARNFVLPFIKDYVKAAEDGNIFKDYKTILQEEIQKNQGDRLDYQIVREEGPDHDKEFCAQVSLNGNVIGEGIGKSKKTAEQSAAKAALELIENSAGAEK